MGASYPFTKYSLSPEEFIAKLRILVNEANYPVEHNDRFLRDGQVRGVRRETTSVNEYRGTLHQCS